MVEFREEWYKNFVDHSNEKNLLVARIRDLITGKPHKSCLEIGLGISPYFAENLSDLFERYLIVEKRLIDISLPGNVSLINTDWEKALIEEKFDLIIASHVIYYFQDLKGAVEKMFKSLKAGGRIFFVVNGKESDYGPFKLAFANMIGVKYEFTYDKLLAVLGGKEYKEYTAQSSLTFKSYEELYEAMRISFDLYPNEYSGNKERIIKYLEANLKGNKFLIDQKIIEVVK